ncbi:DUF6691 family protein [Acinetobacter bouvetii]|uniref:YeeE/YedE family protein n=1 Tax=Acinetobacter bouvetii TaxID=202951 RepID=A0A811GLS1_9GAMM|nr:DUF6691 family protein [Acinetobacter bouvetii]CAB1221456.1 hypothetical protein SFB21_2798 [Acinetobacter bouvetii]
MKNLWAFFFGGLFAIGLMLSGMSNPKKVLDFLDLFGQWDPSLAFVMLGAIAVAFIPFQKAMHQQAPKTVYGDSIDLPKNNKLDLNLLMGSLIFGIGWGIAGICPAPSLTLIGLGYYQGLYFVVAMLIGMFIQRQLMGRYS